MDLYTPLKINDLRAALNALPLDITIRELFYLLRGCLGGEGHPVTFQLHSVTGSQDRLMVCLFQQRMIPPLQAQKNPKETSFSRL